MRASLTKTNRFEKRVSARKFASTQVDVFEEGVSDNAVNKLDNNMKYAANTSSHV